MTYKLVDASAVLDLLLQDDIRGDKVAHAVESLDHVADVGRVGRDLRPRLALELLRLIVRGDHTGMSDTLRVLNPFSSIRQSASATSKGVNSLKRSKGGLECSVPSLA